MIGDYPVDEWDDFCDRLSAKLRTAGRSIASDAESRLDLYEGLRMLLRQLGYSASREIEERDARFSVFAPTFSTTYHTLADAPDYAIYDALVDGRYDYILRGRLGGADLLNFTTMAPGLTTHAPDWSPWSAKSERRGRQITGTLEGDQLQADADGRFEVTISVAAPESGVWLPMTRDTDRIVVRNIYLGAYSDHRRSRPAEMLLERIGTDTRPPAYTGDDLRGGLADLLNAVDRVPLARSAILKRIRQAGVGRFSNDDSFWKGVGSNPRTHFQEAYWRLEPQEALLIDVPVPPPCSFWSLGVTNFWMESLDFRYFPINLNSHSVTYEKDGSFRIVLAHEDPGCANWLSTAGHSQGALLWRWNDVERTPAIPDVQVIDLRREGTD